ncbi:MAG TPA: flagellar biosynthetic protein FliQ [Alphaproteobacteria bacterium]|nr:flagellar biosynthetic protein FliQ [Alphaproteobacteria bacterium]
MDAETVLEVSKGAIMTLLVITSPIMLVALVIGLLVALFQALTSIQEMTLTFVPKILVVFITIIMLANWMGDNLSTYSKGLYERIATIHQQ